MGRRKKVKSSEYLMSNEFKVELKRDGWDKVAHLLRYVSSLELLGQNEIRLDFSEDKDLSVLKFLVDWVISKDVNDMVIWLGSGKRGLFFSGCWVDDIIVDSLGEMCYGCDREELEAYRESRVVGVSAVLKYVAVFVIDKEKGKCTGEK
jgi:hypothetical protein